VVVVNLGFGALATVQAAFKCHSVSELSHSDFLQQISTSVTEQVLWDLDR
jgi:hypothetical protein